MQTTERLWANWPRRLVMLEKMKSASGKEERQKRKDRARRSKLLQRQLAECCLNEADKVKSEHFL